MIGMRALTRARPALRRPLASAMERLGPGSGFGPTGERMQHWRWQMTADALTEGGRHLHGLIDADGHPGYLATARLLLERLFLQLAFTGLAKLVNLALHVLDVRDLVVAILGQLAFGVGAERLGIELLVQVIDFVERLFVGISAVVVLFLGRVFGLVNLGLGVLGFVVLTEGFVHVDRSDF